MTTQTSQTEILTVTGVGVTLAGRPVLDDVSFTRAPGEFTGLIGPNGAGKTTLLRVVLGLQQPTSGTVIVDGRPLSRHNHAAGYVPQKVLLEPDLPLRAKDLVALGIDGQRPGIPLRSRKRADRVQHLADARVGELSGGEQQRVLIAHALISRPRLLLLDEPLANLDIRSSQEIVTLLAKIATEQQVAVLLSAHEINPLLPVMDRVIYLANGRAATGTTEEVIRTDVLSRLYGYHVDVLHVHGRIRVVAGPPEAAAGVPTDVALQAG